MSGAPGRVVCPSVLDLAFAPSLRDGLVQAVAAGGDVEVDATEVTQGDTACVQLLCAAAVALRGSGRSLILLRPSPPLSRVVERLGVGPALNMTPAPSAPLNTENAR